MTHKIKIQDQFADAVLNEEKTFEVRLNDRNYQRGDYVKFNVVFEGHEMTNHPLNKQLFKITYVLSGWGLKEGYVAFGIKRVPTVEEELEKVL